MVAPPLSPQQVRIEAVNLDASISLDEPVSPQIYRILRQAIIRMHLKPGQTLSEQEVARQLGVSRQPVREAFIRLEDAGLVRIVPQRGTFVTTISEEAVKTAQFVRMALETAIMRRAAANITDEEAAALMASLKRQEAAHTTGVGEEFYVEDEDFHRTLARIAGCEAAWAVIEREKAQMDRVRYLSLPQATPIDKLVSQHRAIVEAVVNHDPEAAAAATELHLNEILASLPSIMARHPEVFSDTFEVRRSFGGGRAGRSAAG